MAGFLRFLVFSVVLVALMVLVLVPLVASPLLAQMVRDMGLRSETLDVNVELLDPSLLTGHSRSMRVVAGDAELQSARIGLLNVALTDVSFFDRTWRGVTGELREVVITLDGEAYGVSSIRLDGPARAAVATARLSRLEAEALVRFAARREGLPVDGVRLTDTGMIVTVSGIEGTAQVRVRGGALVLAPDIGGNVVLFRPAPSDPLELSEAWVSAEGLNVRGIVDTTRLAGQLVSR